MLLANFFLKNLPSLTLPCLSYLHTVYIPNLYEEALKYIADTYSMSKFLFLIDETKDSKSRCVINVIGYFLKTNEYILLDTAFEETVYNNIIIKILQKTLDQFHLFWKNCIGISTVHTWFWQ